MCEWCQVQESVEKWVMLWQMGPVKTSQVSGVSQQEGPGDGSNLEWGVTGAAGADALLACFSTMGISSCSAMTTSNTSLASATLFLRTLALNRHNACSLLERFMSRLVISVAFPGLSLMTTAIRQSFSDSPGATEPDRDE